MAKKVRSKKSINASSIGEDLYTSLTNIVFSYKGKKYELDIGGELLVSTEDIHSQVERIPAILGYLNSIVSKIDTEYRNKKALLKKIEAEIDKELRESGLVGEQRVSRAIKRDERWIDAVIEVNRAKERSSRARGLWYALKEKAIVLLSRSSDIRNTPSDSIRGVSRKDVVNFDSDEDDDNYDDDGD